MIEQNIFYIPNIDELSFRDLRKKFAFIMGQFLDYLTSVFTGAPNKGVDGNNKSSGNHVTFADNSFTQVFRRSSSNPTKLTSMKQINKRTIHIYQFISSIACILHLSMVTWPKVKVEEFDIMQPDGWQLITLSLVPILVHLASLGAMTEVSRPLEEASQLTSKNSNLNLNDNDFIYSLKVVILLMAMCQLSSIVSDQILWSVMIIIPFWCYQLTSKMARTEYERYSPSPKKSWAKLNVSKSPIKSATPTKQDNHSNLDKVKNTPRTRTRKAVKNIMTSVGDKYHAFEQNVAHQLSQKIFTPLSPRVKMIET